VRETLQDAIAASLPPAWVSRLYPLIAGLYREAAANVQEYTLLGDAERRNLLPHLRRNLVEAGVRKHSLDSGLKATVEWTATGSAQFTLIRSPRARITLSKTAHEWALPEICYFRKQHSRVNDMLMQTNLFPIAAPAENDDEVLYAIITHGPERNGDALGFVNIGFPRPDMKAWAEPTVSILSIQERQMQRFQKPADFLADEQEKQRTGKLKAKVQKKTDEGKDTA
jgi:hypothetical protein